MNSDKWLYQPDGSYLVAKTYFTNGDAGLNYR